MIDVCFLRRLKGLSGIDGITAGQDDLKLAHEIEIGALSSSSSSSSEGTVCILTLLIAAHPAMLEI